jgi:hypothetical protein
MVRKIPLSGKYASGSKEESGVELALNVNRNLKARGIEPQMLSPKQALAATRGGIPRRARDISTLADAQKDAPFKQRLRNLKRMDSLASEAQQIGRAEYLRWNHANYLLFIRRANRAIKRMFRRR